VKGAPLAAAALALLAGGCQYSYRVRAERHGDSYVLTARDGDGHFAPHACVRRIAVIEAGRTIWEIENPGNGWPHEARRCDSTSFPIIYGRAPAGFATVVAAVPLRADGDYVIVGEGVARYHGRFRLSAGLEVVNASGRDARRPLDPRLVTSH